MNKKQLTRKQLESKIESLNKEQVTIKEWFEKKQTQLDKNLEIVKNKGFLTDLDFGTLEEETRYDFIKKISLEISKADGNTTKTVINKMWSIEGMVTDWAHKKGRVIRIDEWIAKYQAEIDEKYGELTKEQLDARDAVKKEKELYAYLKREAETIKCESLDKWLSEYREMYIEWVNENFVEWKRTRLLREADEVVKEQKTTILVKSFPKIGKLTDIKFRRIGDDGTFNGIAIGEKGTCEIRTIIAGGYNIQRLHFRVLVN